MSPEVDGVDVILRLQNLQRFVAGTREAAAGVKSIGKATAETDAVAARGGTGRMSGVLGLVRKASLGAAVGLAAMGVEATKMSVNFDQSMTLVHTQAGASTKEVASMRGEVLKLAQVMPQGPQALAEGLYHLESIGLRGSKALNALKVASQGAMVGNANLEATASALGAAWLSNIKGAGNLHHTMALLNATVGAGNMRMDDLVHALGTGVLPSAKVAGLGIKDVMSALAILTDEGYQGSSAMAQFATSLHFLYAPTKKAEGALENIHLSGVRLSNTLSGPGGLHAALTLLHERLQKFGGSDANQKQILSSILPGGRGRVLLVLMNQLDRLQMKERQITRTSGDFGKSVSQSHEIAANKIREAWSRMQVALIKLGDMLRPVAVVIIDAFSKVVVFLTQIPDHVKAVINWFDGLPKPVKLAAEAVGILVAQGLALYAAFKLWGLLTAIWNAMKIGIMGVRAAFILLQLGSGPLMLAFAGITTAVVLIIHHWHEMSPLARALAVGLTAIATALALAKWGSTLLGVRRVMIALRGLAAYRWAVAMAGQLQSGFAASRLINLAKLGLARFRLWLIGTSTATGAAAGTAEGRAENAAMSSQLTKGGGLMRAAGRVLGLAFGIGFVLAAANQIQDWFKNTFGGSLPSFGTAVNPGGLDPSQWVNPVAPFVHGNAPQPPLQHGPGGVGVTPGFPATPAHPSHGGRGAPASHGFGPTGTGHHARKILGLGVSPLMMVADASPWQPGARPWRGAAPDQQVTPVDTTIADDIHHTTIVQVDKREIGRAVSTFNSDKKARG